MLPRRPGNPLRQHGERAARLLELSEGAPLPLEHREGRGVKWIAGLEPATKKIPRLRLRGRGIDSHPFRGQTCGPFEAPIRILLCDFLTRALVTDILKQASPHHFTDFGFIVRNKVLSNAPDDFRNPV